LEKEWFEIVDTATKIGLGAIITGFFTYLGMKLSHTNNQKRFMLEHKTKVLEKVADDVDLYFSSWNGLVSKIAGITKHMNHDQDTIEFTQKQYKNIKDRDIELVESWAQRQTSLSKLRLLKAKTASEKLIKCFKLEHELRDMIFFEKEYPNYNKISDYRQKSKNIQKDFQLELAEFYEKLSA